MKSCVIGYPISHSLSPIIHNYWLKKYNIEGSYKAIEVLPENLEKFIKEMPQNGLTGCNITLPHKEAAWKIVSQMREFSDKDTLPSHVAKYMKAINTIYINDAGEYIATNTDFIGFARNLIEAQPNYDYQNSIAYIIGAGGAAKAIAFALASMRVMQIVITNRTIDKCFEIKELLCKNFGFSENKFDIVDWEKRNEVFPHCNLVVNTTSLGMKGKAELEVDISKLPENSLVTDIIYNPLHTKLLTVAKNNGQIIVDGLGMLLHQAAPGFESWFGKKPEIDEGLRKAVLEKL
jgi:shikimate dehydrogenase